MKDNILKAVRENLVGGTNISDLSHNVMFQITEAYLVDKGFPMDIGHDKLFSVLEYSNLLKTEDYREILNSVLGERLFSVWGAYDIFLIDEKYLVTITTTTRKNYKYVTSMSMSYYGIESIDEREKITESLISASKGKLQRTPFRPDVITFSYAYPKKDDVSIIHRDCEKLPFSSIESNYAASVRPAIRELVPLLQNAERGLVTIHGPIGTGKTHLLKALMTEVGGDRKPLICIPPTEFIRDGQLLVQALNEVENPIVIFEDLGNMFEADYRNRASDAFSTFINFSDGLLSLLHKAVFVLTFNQEITSIDKAMTRPGRCLANIEVPNLSYDEALELLPEEKKSLLSKDDTSLAKVYSLTNGGQLVVKDENKREMGFLKLGR